VQAIFEPHVGTAAVLVRETRQRNAAALASKVGDFHLSFTLKDLKKDPSFEACLMAVHPDVPMTHQHLCTNITFGTLDVIVRWEGWESTKQSGAGGRVGSAQHRQQHRQAG